MPNVGITFEDFGVKLRSIHPFSLVAAVEGLLDLGMSATEPVSSNFFTKKVMLRPCREGMPNCLANLLLASAPFSPDS